MHVVTLTVDAQSTGRQEYYRMVAFYVSRQSHGVLSVSTVLNELP